MVVDAGLARAKLPPYIQPFVEANKCDKAPAAELDKVIVFPFRFTLPRFMVRTEETVTFPNSVTCGEVPNELLIVRLLNVSPPTAVMDCVFAPRNETVNVAGAN